jgi:hypothetical protein
MVISVKAFGCMPSSGVSDGVQSLVTARHPDAIFCAIETTGDGAVSVQSRVLMDLFKARQKAQKEYQELLQASGLSQEELEHRARRRGYARALFYPTHAVAGTASNTLVNLEPRLKVQVSPHAGSRAPNVQRPAPIGQTRVAFRDGVITLAPVASASVGSTNAAVQ